MARSCQGRVALVTGASRGIGAGIAQRLAAEGARVAVTARSLGPEDSAIDGSLAETVERIAGLGGTAVAFVADLAGREQQPGDIVAQIERELGPVDILVNNAAANFYHPLEQMTEKRFRIAMDVNLWAPLELTRAVAGGMHERREGWVLNISSASAKLPRQHPASGSSGPLLYVATKAAIERATAALAEELYSHRIAVNALAPQAGVRTAASEQYYTLPEEALEPIETMAEAALALCSGDPNRWTGRITRSLEFLVERGAPVYELDGRTLLQGWQPSEIPQSRLDPHREADESIRRGQ